MQLHQSLLVNWSHKMAAMGKSRFAHDRSISTYNYVKGQWQTVRRIRLTPSSYISINIFCTTHNKRRRTTCLKNKPWICMVSAHNNLENMSWETRPQFVTWISILVIKTQIKASELWPNVPGYHFQTHLGIFNALFDGKKNGKVR